MAVICGWSNWLVMSDQPRDKCLISSLAMPRIGTDIARRIPKATIVAVGPLTSAVSSLGP